MANSLGLKVQKCLNKEIDKTEDSDMAMIRSTLRDVMGYGRNDLQKIGNSPLRLYDEMSKKGHMNDYDILLNILTKSELDEVAEKIKEIINKHGPAPAHIARPQNLSMNNGAKRCAADDIGAAAKRKCFSKSLSSQDSFVSPDGYSNPGFPPPQLQYYLSEADRIYQLDESRHGLVAVINNFTANDTSLYRKGTMEDEERIKKLFTTGEFQGSYRVMNPVRNLNKVDFESTLKIWAERLDAEDESINSFFLFIMSHGDKEGVKTFYTDKEKPDPKECVVPVDKIVDTFKKCLKGRPKVIVVQACMGEKDNAPDVFPDSERPTVQHPEELGGDENVEEVEADAPILTTIPDAADVLTALATVRGYRSYRGKGNIGSWFIKDFIDQLEESHKSHLYYSTHILDVLTEVQFQVAKRNGKTYTSDSTQENKKVYVKQMPCFQSTLRKKFYLLPPKLPYAVTSPE